MYMNSPEYEFNKMSTVAKTIVTSFEAAGGKVNHIRCWEETYYPTHMENPFHRHVEDTYRDTRSKYNVARIPEMIIVHVRCVVFIIIDALTRHC